jgi:hypothetical protein
MCNRDREVSRDPVSRSKFAVCEFAFKIGTRYYNKLMHKRFISSGQFEIEIL